MVKKLRKKFVLVTTVMMLALFGMLWIPNNYYLEYWSDRDILSIIELLTDSGLFSGNADIDSGKIVEGFTEEEPIIGIVVDGDGQIVSRQIIGGDMKKIVISDETISKMANAGKSGYKIDGYIFTRRNLKDSNILIVAINSNMNDDSIAKIIPKLILYAAGLAMLIGISFFLSRFVTMPAEEALAREKRFISDASHELKTPLGAISVNAQALELKGNESIHVKNIISETGRMGRLIDRLLTLSRLEENELVEKKDFSLSDVAQEMMLTYEGVAFEKSRSLEYTIEDGIIFNGNEDEIRQLIAILLDNAIKNSNENGQIWFNCRKVNGIVFMDVKNTGKGISEAFIPHIFERFYTTDRSRNSSSFGLGLAIAKEITERHGGTISVNSIPDKETTFIVKF